MSRPLSFGQVAVAVSDRDPAGESFRGEIGIFPIHQRNARTQTSAAPANGHRSACFHVRVPDGMPPPLIWEGNFNSTPLSLVLR